MRILRFIYRARFRFFVALCLLPTFAVQAAEPFTEEFFEAARIEVLQLYVGMDDVIHQIFNQIKPWYLHKQTRLKPLVIGVWGMTGTGKSSLIDNILRSLKLTRDARAFDMESFAVDGGRSRDFLYELAGSMIVKKEVAPDFILDMVQVPEHPVLILDEFQKIFTRKGRETISRPGAQGIWELLGNDGRIVVENRARRSLLDMAYNPHQGFSLPQRFYGLNNAEAQQEWRNQMIAKAKELVEVTPVQVTVDLHGALVFVLGNLDNVFPGSAVFTSESITADQLHRLTSSITPTNIKGGLGAIFRPEHVSRLGNRHVIVPTLTEEQFRSFVDTRLLEISGTLAKDMGLDLVFTEQFKERIYREGVVPSQGMRPIRAVVDSFALDPLGDLYSLVKKQAEYTSTNLARCSVDVLPRAEKATWRFENGPLKDRAFEFAIPSEFIQSLSPHPDPLRSLVSIRQAGAAAVWIQVDQHLPNAVYARSRSGEKLGYVESANEVDGEIRLRSELVAQVAKDLAGFVAEEMIFGEASLSSTEDFRRATRKVAEMLVGGLGNPGNPWVLDPSGVTRNSRDVEKEADTIVTEAMAIARKILETEREFFRVMAKKLYDQTIVTRTDLEALTTQSWSDSAAAERIVSGKPAKHVCQSTAEAFFHADSGFVFKTPQTPRGKLGFGD